MLTVTTLASGSNGNAALVSFGRTHILLDAGISARRITTALKALGVPPQELSARLMNLAGQTAPELFMALSRAVDYAAGILTWNTPYAARQYYEPMNHTTAGTTDHWDQEMMKNDGDDLREFARQLFFQ